MCSGGGLMICFGCLAALEDELVAVIACFVLCTRSWLLVDSHFVDLRLMRDAFRCRCRACARFVSGVRGHLVYALG